MARRNPKFKAVEKFNAESYSLETFKRACKAAAPKALARLIELVNDEDPNVALGATKELLTRAWGKPETVTSERVGASLAEALEAIAANQRANGEALQALTAGEHAKVINGQAMAAEVLEPLVSRCLS